MNARFAPGAQRLSGLVMRALGWRPDEFWNATPAELAALFAPPPGAGGWPLSRTELATLLEQEHE